MSLYNFLVILGCGSLIIAGLMSAFTTKSYGLGIANICVGIANLIFMLK